MTVAGVLVRSRDAGLVDRVRASWGQAVTACQGSQALGEAFRSRPTVVVLDDREPGASAFRARLARDHRTAAAVALWVLADGTAMAEGTEPADDHVHRSRLDAEFEERLGRCVRRAQARCDVHPLTGLPGGRAALDRLRSDLAGGAPVACLHVDLDAFKAVNDRLGFAAGDRLIAEVAGVILEALEAAGVRDGLAAHLGGDDFIVVCAPSAAPRLAEAIVRGFDGRACSLSVGVAVATPGEDAEMLARRAGEAKLRAKARPGSAWAGGAPDRARLAAPARVLS